MNLIAYKNRIEPLFTEDEKKDSINIKNNEVPDWIDYATHITHFEITTGFKNKEFKGYEVEIDDSIVKNSEEIIQQYRPEKLNFREENTYSKIDSVFKAEKFDKYLKYSKILTRGTLSIGKKLELNLLDILQYNDYEGFRPNINLRTNENFHTRLGLQAFVGYGFKDQAFKHGLGMNYLINKSAAGNIFVQYSQDVHAMGRKEHHFIYQKPDLYKSLNNVYFSDYYASTQFLIGYEQDFFRNLTASASIEKSTEESKAVYSYNFNRTNHQYQLTQTHLNLLWKPFAKYVKTPYGKVTIEDKQPTFRLYFTKSWADLGSDFDFETLEFKAEHQLKIFTQRLKINANFGYSWGNLPIWYNFEGLGNAKSGSGILDRISVAANNSFETLQGGQFYMDKYVSYQFTQSLPSLKLGKRRMPLQLLYRGFYGEQNSSKHILLTAKAPQFLYQEIGAEIFNIYNMLGIGGYYKIGSYNQKDFNQDFYLKLTVRMPF